MDIKTRIYIRHIRPKENCTSAENVINWKAFHFQSAFIMSGSCEIRTYLHLILDDLIKYTQIKRNKCNGRATSNRHGESLVMCSLLKTQKKKKIVKIFVITVRRITLLCKQSNSTLSDCTIDANVKIANAVRTRHCVDAVVIELMRLHLIVMLIFVAR